MRGPVEKGTNTEQSGYRLELDRAKETERLLAGCFLVECECVWEPEHLTTLTIRVRALVWVVVVWIFEGVVGRTRPK